MIGSEKSYTILVVGKREKREELAAVLSNLHRCIDVIQCSSCNDAINSATADPQMVIELDNAQDTRSRLSRHFTAVPVLGVKEAELFFNIGSEMKSLRESAQAAKEAQEQFNAVLNSAQEAIQVADREGNLIYLNKAFTDVTGILPDKRLGQNVLEISPGGALAEVIRTRKSVFGKMMVTESGVDVMCNASPIIVDGRMTGAVVVFRDVSDMKRLAQLLHQNRVELDTLKKGINELAAANYSFDNIVGESPPLQRCISLAKRVSQNSSTALITGESGTGKELLAHAIHNYGPRAGKAFIRINCAAIPSSLLESELFGYERGAFTGATAAKMGKFELADKGTIFLDEIGDMELALQSKILRVLQEKEIERLGASKPKPIDVHILAATNSNLLERVAAGAFRGDLYYRLNVVPLVLPPLRERRTDIPLLAEDILKRKNRRYGKQCTLHPLVLDKLRSYHWPGNIRELENVLERAVLIADNSFIGPEMVFLYPEGEGNMEQAPANSAGQSLAEGEKTQIEKALQLYGTDVEGKRRAAKSLRISLSTLYNKLEKYNLMDGYRRIPKDRNGKTGSL